MLPASTATSLPSGFKFVAVMPRLFATGAVIQPPTLSPMSKKDRYKAYTKPACS